MMATNPYSCAIVLPHLRVQNANAVSSPMTWGFPAMSAFAGFAHALQRALVADGCDIQIDAVAVVCHKAEPLLADGPSYAPRSFRLTRNPLDQTGNTSAIVEEGRMHLTISLVLTIAGANAPSADGEEATALAQKIMEQTLSMRIAGGSVVPPGISAGKPRLARVFIWNTQSKSAVQKKLLRMLMPGFALISRADLLTRHLAELREKNSALTALDALLDLSALHIDPNDVPNKDGSVSWTVGRRKKGFLVPIPLGFAAISPMYEPGIVKNVRDASVPFRFVESVLSLGEWKSPHRLTDLEDLLWRYDAQPALGTYLVTNSQA
jgi:CRISPR-associated protein Csy2